MTDKKKEDQVENLEENKNDQQKETDKTSPKGSGVFTADGKELPEIDGGYTISGTGSDYEESDFTSV